MSICHIRSLGEYYWASFNSIALQGLLYVTAAGFDALLPVTTLGRTVSDTVTGREGHNDDSVRDGYRILLLIEWAGTHSPHREGGGPCPLGTHRHLFKALE